MRNSYWIIYFGLIFIGWGIFSISNQRYVNQMFGYPVNLGPNHVEIGIFELIIGLVLIGLWKRKGKF